MTSQLPAPRSLLPAPCFAAFCFLLSSVPCSWSAESLARSTNAVPPTAAAEEILKQTSKEQNLRLGSLDLFPHGGASVTFDDNLLISSTDKISDVQWALSPGATLALGDVSTSIAGPVTIDRLRTLLYNSLADETSRPRRFLGADYTPSFNLYTDHDQYNNVDHRVQVSGGYNFSRTVTELDFDFRHGQVKDNGVGDLVTLANYAASLRNRYDLSEKSSLEVNGYYLRYDYIEPQLQGYQDFKNEDWFNHRLSGKFLGGVGLAFGYLDPTESSGQTYEQAQLRGIYRLGDKIYFSAAGGVEWRQYSSQADDTLNPVFSVTGVYQPRESTTFTLEMHRREAASPYTGYNYTTIGFSAGVRQRVFDRVYLGVTGGFDNLEYNGTATSTAANRVDKLFYVRVTADYDFNPHWSAGLFYTFQQDESDIDVYSYENNLAGFRFLWRY